jgi:hypothetical protein
MVSCWRRWVDSAGGGRGQRRRGGGCACRRRVSEVGSKEACVSRARSVLVVVTLSRLAHSKVLHPFQII